MTQEDKDLLLKDIFGRIPYGVKCSYLDIEFNNTTYGNLESFEYDDDKDLIFVIDGIGIYSEHVKPYLFPMSSMTEEQKKELITITDGKFRYMWGDITNAIPRKNTSEWGISENAFINGIKVINSLYIWLLKNHFDINGLIPKGLAIDATGLNIY